MSFWSISKICGLLLFFGIFDAGFPQEPFIRQYETNPNYEEGDWISYSVARFVTSIAIGRQYVYFGTRHSGITRFHQYRETWDFPWTISNGLPDNNVSVVAFDLDNDFVWCATSSAISYYHPSARKWRNAFKDEFGLPQSDPVVSIGIGGSKIYFQSRAGRMFESNKFGGVILLTSNPAAANHQQIKWFGRRGQNVREFPSFFMNDGYLFNSRGFVEDAQFRQAEVVTALQDEWGSMWIGTWGLGAGKADTRSLRLRMLQFGPANFSVNAMAFSGDILWSGGSTLDELSRGISAWDTQRKTWQQFGQKYVTGLRSDQIFQITPDEDIVWFSTAYGLSRFSNDARDWQTFDTFDGLADNIVYDVAVNDSSIWVATDNGISSISRASLAKKDSVKITPVNPGNLSIIRIRDLELMENLLWAATDNGIYIYDIDKGVGGFSDEIEGPFSLSITSISRYENEVWFGSTNGIDVFDMVKRDWLGVPEGRAFPNIVINKIVADESAVWAATDKGAMKYNRRSKSWRTFTMSDGLLDNRVNTILPDGDYIWFGTESGITQFYWNDPSRID